MGPYNGRRKLQRADEFREFYRLVERSRAKLEREVGHSMLKDKNGSVYLDKLEPNRGNMNTEIMPDCGIMCYLSIK